MLRQQIRALGLIFQQHATHPGELSVFEKKLSPRIQRISTNVDTQRILDRISKTNLQNYKNIGYKEWIDRINILMSHKFSESECFRMISNRPGILEIPLRVLEDTLRQYSLAPIPFKKIQRVLLERPMLLEVQHSVVRKRLPYFIANCKNSDLFVQLLITSPYVMFDDWTTVVDKINYLSNVRGYQMPSTVESCALSRTIEFIKFRFDILEKCGIYKQQSLHAHKINKHDKSKHKNPSLKSILSNSKNFFSSKVAKISVEEYDVCYALFSEECYEHEDDDIYDEEDECDSNDDDDDTDVDSDDDDDTDMDSDDEVDHKKKSRHGNKAKH